MKPQYFDKKAFAKYAIITIVVMLAMKYTNGIGFALVVPMFFFSLFTNKTTDAFFYLLLTVATVMGNQFFFPKGSIYAMLNRGMLMAAGTMLVMTTIGAKGAPLIRPFQGLMVYLIFIAFPSAFGWCPGISFLKLLLFTTVYSAYVCVANKVMMSNRLEVYRVRSVVLIFALLFVVGSLALKPFPGISQMQSEEYLAALTSGAHITSLFKGMTMHSQSLGPCVASIATVVLADMVFGVRRWTKMHLAILLCAPYVIYPDSVTVA